MTRPLFRVKKLLGEGVYGKVYEAESSINGKSYAVKANLGSVILDGMMSLEDLNFSKYIHNHPSFVNIEDFCPRMPFEKNLELIQPSKSRTNLKYDSLFFVMEIADTTLSNLMNERRYQELIPHIRKLMAQILLGIEFMHTMKFCHRDIKPNNILIFFDENNVPNAKISDYGFAKCLSKEKNTTGIQNVVYRAPEIITCSPYYTGTIDIWSAGIMFYEMVTGGKIPFIERGINDHNIIERIHQTFNLTGVEYPGVSKGYINGISSIPSRNTFLKDLNNNIHADLSSYLSRQQCINLLERMLDVRMTRYNASECLNHPFFTEDENIKEMIKETRIKHNIREDGTALKVKVIIVVSDSPARNLMFRHANEIKEKAPTNYPWFTYQIWFSTIDLFDRWLYWEINTHGEKACINETDIFIAYYTCLYIMIKTCSSRKNFSFANLNSNLKMHRDTFIKLEKIIVTDVVDREIFRPTIFDELPNFDEVEDFPRLRNLILNKLPKYNGISWRKMANSYIAFKEKERAKEKGDPLEDPGEKI